MKKRFLKFVSLLAFQTRMVNFRLMISTLSARKTTATIALRQTELVVTCLDIRFFFSHKRICRT